jgi:hypothetical protein
MSAEPWKHAYTILELHDAALLSPNAWSRYGLRKAKRAYFRFVVCTSRAGRLLWKAQYYLWLSMPGVATCKISY